MIKILGDILDFWSISSFLKDPTRKNTLNDELDEAQRFFRHLRDDFPQAEITYLAGNHEDRWRRYIFSKAPELAPLRDFCLDRLIGIEDLHIEFYPEMTDIDREGEVLFTHGTIISQDSAMTARRNLKRFGCSCVTAHTHRLGTYYETKIGGSFVACENGCLCRLDLAKEWRQGFPNWQNGITIVFMKDRRFVINQVYISKGQLLWQGDEYSTYENLPLLPISQ